MSVNITVRTDNMICTDVSGVSLDPIVQPVESTDGSLVQAIAGYRVALLREGVGFSESPRLNFKTKEEAENVFRGIYQQIFMKVEESVKEDSVGKNIKKDEVEISLDEEIQKENALSEAVKNLENEKNEKNEKSFVSEEEKDFVRSMIKQASINSSDESLFAKNLLRQITRNVLSRNSVTGIRNLKTSTYLGAFKKMVAILKEYLELADTETSRELSKKLDAFNVSAPFDDTIFSDCIYCILGNLKSAGKFKYEFACDSYEQKQV